MDWATYITNLALNCGDPNLVTDGNFQEMIPLAVYDAESRLCRDLDFLGAVVVDTSILTATNNRTINWSNNFFVVEAINVITPAGTTDPNLGTRNPLVPATKEVCDYLYPSATGSGVPQYLGRVTQSTAVLAPWPDQAYTLEITGTQRPTPLSATNTTTFISTYLADLFMDASMVYASGYMQNFAAASSDNPAMATNWEGHYQAALKSAAVEEARKKFQAQGWSSAQPSAITPPRA